MFLRFHRYLHFVFVALRFCTDVSAFPIFSRHRSLSRDQISVISRSCRQHSVLTLKLSQLLCGRCRPVRTMELTSYLGLFVNLSSTSAHVTSVYHIFNTSAHFSNPLPPNVKRTIQVTNYLANTLEMWRELRRYLRGYFLFGRHEKPRQRFSDENVTVLCLLPSILCTTKSRQDRQSEMGKSYSRLRISFLRLAWMY